ncbi:hypothetical protein Y032_0565g11 [Ancylostoma ceylanicum]|uniref:Uncharacterized protein n=1 Tax=Ancylostoma ceylanicum TaxID=53326 RepID=A0A016WPQ3_9BILA|nr:hypothetical protein Y032_0565g11 [Ancylostoma ceylanicum]
MNYNCLTVLLHRLHGLVCLDFKIQIEGDSQLDAVFQDVSATIDQELFIREDEGGNSLEGSKNSFSTNE